MAISRITAHSAQANSVAITTPTLGDLILVFAHRDGSTTAPSLPAGYTSIDNSGANTNSARIGWKYSDGTETTSSTWTNATSIAVGIYRGVHAVGPIGNFAAGGGASTTLSFTGYTGYAQSGSSWVVGFAGHRTATNVGTNNPAGLTSRSSATDVAIFDSGGASNDYSTGTASVSANSGWRTYTVELRDTHTLQTRYVNTASTVGTQDGTTNTPGNSGTAAFATLAQALDSLPAALTNPLQILCSGTAADPATCNQAHWDFTTTAADYIVVQGNNTTGKWSTAHYRIEVTDQHCIYNNFPAHVRLDRLQGQITVTTSLGNDTNHFRLATANNNTTGNVDHRMSNCIARTVVSGGATDNSFGFQNSDPTTASGGTASGGTCKIWNCVAFGGYCGFASDGTAWATNNLYNYNCTAYGSEFPYLDVQKCVNCIAAGATGGAGAFVSTGTTGHSNNASDDSSAGGTSARTNQTFSFVDAANGDFHLQSGDTGAKDFGLSDPGSGLFSDDIDGETRTGSWDIGADEYVATSTFIAAQNKRVIQQAVNRASTY